MASAHAAEVPSVREVIGSETYDIRGDSAQALAAAIRIDGPMAPWGQRVGGYTTADIRWWLRTVLEADGCRLANAQVWLEATVTRLRWVDAATGPAKLRRRWPLFLDALARHEHTHLQLMRESAERARTALAAAARNIELRARTRHGRSEGVGLES